MPRRLAPTVASLVFLVIVGSVNICCSSPAIAQQSRPIASMERENGVKLSKEGDFKGAAAILRKSLKEHKDDADAWRYLGMALSRLNDVKGARKAYEAALRIRPDFPEARTGLAYELLLGNNLKDAQREAERGLSLNAQNPEAHYLVGIVNLRRGESGKALEQADAALRINSALAPALLLRSQALLNIYSATTEGRHQHIRGAAESLDRYLKLAPETGASRLWRDQLQTLQLYASWGDAADPNRTIFGGSEVQTRVRILAKPEPSYTGLAREAGINGTVVLQAVFGADGIVGHILVLRPLSLGLTEQCIQAVHRIKFIPAIKDGHSVSTILQVEYSFNVF